MKEKTKQKTSSSIPSFLLQNEESAHFKDYRDLLFSSFLPFQNSGLYFSLLFFSILFSSFYCLIKYYELIFFISYTTFYILLFICLHLFSSFSACIPPPLFASSWHFQNVIFISIICYIAVPLFSYDQFKSALSSMHLDLPNELMDIMLSEISVNSNNQLTNLETVVDVFANLLHVNFSSFLSSFPRFFYTIFCLLLSFVSLFF